MYIECFQFKGSCVAFKRTSQSMDVIACSSCRYKYMRMYSETRSRGGEILLKEALSRSQLSKRLSITWAAGKRHMLLTIKSALASEILS